MMENLVISAPINEKNEFTYKLLTPLWWLRFSHPILRPFPGKIIVHFLELEKPIVNDKLSFDILDYYHPIRLPGIFNRSGIQWTSIWILESKTWIQGIFQLLFFKERESNYHRRQERSQLNIAARRIWSLVGLEAGFYPRKKLQNEYERESGFHFSSTSLSWRKVRMDLWTPIYTFNTSVAPYGTSTMQRNQPISMGSCHWWRGTTYMQRRKDHQLLMGLAQELLCFIPSLKNSQ